MHDPFKFCHCDPSSLLSIPTAGGCTTAPSEITNARAAALTTAEHTASPLLSLSYSGGEKSGFYLHTSHQHLFVLPTTKCHPI